MNLISLSTKYSQLFTFYSWRPHSHNRI